MASLKRIDADPKASSLPDSATAHRPASPASKSGKGDGKRSMGRRGSRGWVTLAVDIILLLVIAGLVVGAVFAYRAIRELYAPTWETREVVFEVEMTGIDLDLVKYGQDGRPTMTGHPLWSSDRSDADFFGHRHRRPYRPCIGGGGEEQPEPLPDGGGHRPLPRGQGLSHGRHHAAGRYEEYLYGRGSCG